MTTSHAGSAWSCRLVISLAVIRPIECKPSWPALRGRGRGRQAAYCGPEPDGGLEQQLCCADQAPGPQQCDHRWAPARLNQRKCTVFFAFLPRCRACVRAVAVLSSGLRWLWRARLGGARCSPACAAEGGYPPRQLMLGVLRCTAVAVAYSCCCTCMGCMERVSQHGVRVRHLVWPSVDHGHCQLDPDGEPIPTVAQVEQAWLVAPHAFGSLGASGFLHSALTAIREAQGCKQVVAQQAASLQRMHCSSKTQRSSHQ